MISIRAHNTIDYLMGSLLIVAPWLFDLSQVPEARNLMIVCGLTLVCYSALTSYFYAVVRVIPLGLHMTFDVIVGALVILGPALFGYRDRLTTAQAVVETVIGLSLLALVAVTRPQALSGKLENRIKEKIDPAARRKDRDDPRSAHHVKH